MLINLEPSYVKHNCILTTRELHIIEVAIHKDFNFTRQVNDIALLKTSKNLIQP